MADVRDVAVTMVCRVHDPVAVVEAARRHRVADDGVDAAAAAERFPDGAVGQALVELLNSPVSPGDAGFEVVAVGHDG